MHSQPDRAIQQLWGLGEPTVRGPKAKWSAEEIARAAVGLADEVGLDALSLARVAERLGMTTTAVYRYVDSKAELVELMVDDAVGDPPPLAGDDWQARCRTWVTALADRYAEHPWLTEVRPRRMPTQPRSYAWIDALVAAVDGVPDVEPVRLALLLDGLVRSYMALEVGLRDAEPVPWLGEVVAARFPRLASRPQQDAGDARGELTAAVEVVLRGAQR